MGEYFAEHERAFELPVHRPDRVTAIREASPEESAGERLFRVETDSGEWLTGAVIDATGT